MELRADSGLALLRRAVAADTADFVAFHSYVQAMRENGRFEELRREYPIPATSARAATFCRAVMAHFPIIGNPEAEPMIERLTRTPDASGCSAALIVRLRPRPTPEQLLSDVRAALSLVPEDATLWVIYAERLAEGGQMRDAENALRQSLRVAMPHPWFLLDLYREHAARRRALGDTAGAAALIARLDAAALRDDRPWVQLWRLRHAEQLARSSNRFSRADLLTQQQLRIVRKFPAPAHEHAILLSAAERKLDLQNDPREAVRLLTLALGIADSVHSPTLGAMTHFRRGRALAKLGDFSAAERDLLLALPAADDLSPTLRAEVHHNLAHVYEGTGRWPDAARQADLFAQHSAFARSFSALHMMSLRDAGSIRWKAGWHAAARASFDAMVREIDSREENFFYAGEYYERVGDYARASTYYQKGAASGDLSEMALDLAGLARMYDALGLRDSARMFAERHDAPGVARGSSRLLPTALLVEGRIADALRLARHDLEEQEARASAQGSAAALLQYARLLLNAGQLPEAIAFAAKAERRAAAAQLSDERIAALLVRGIAETRAKLGGSVTTLLRARDLVRMAPSAQAELEVELALGDAYAANGNSRDALAAYGRAARASQRVTSSFESAIDRARHRERRIAPFDAALRVLLRDSVSEKTFDELLAWSAHRKNALAQNRHAGSGEPPAAGVAAWRQVLGDTGALLDYLAVDGRLYAVVVTAAEQRVARLTMPMSEVQSLVERLRSPLSAVDQGYLDLVRAPFDLAVAHRLYRGLVAPVEQWLDRATSLTIVPDGIVHGVPFAALPRTAPPTRGRDYYGAEYLLDRYAITLAVTTAGTGARRAASRGAPRVMVVGGAVAGGKRELDAVATSWPSSRVTMLSGVRATESALRRNAPGQAIIHFAVHARADESDALASFIELERDSVDDGYLHVSEIAGLGFRGNLVILTGCETLPGRVFAGSGPFGIANAFIGAGAGHVIATRWPIGESAADISAELHRLLARGVPPTEALRAAQLTLRRDSARAHPFYWGGYTLIAGSAR